MRGCNFVIVVLYFREAKNAHIFSSFKKKLSEYSRIITNERVQRSFGAVLTAANGVKIDLSSQRNKFRLVAMTEVISVTVLEAITAEKTATTTAAAATICTRTAAPSAEATIIAPVLATTSVTT